MAIVALIVAFVAFVLALFSYLRFMKIGDEVKVHEESIDEFVSSFNETGGQMIEIISNSQEREKKMLREIEKLRSVLYREICDKYDVTEEEIEKSAE